ncbi:hypothetical protein KUTeg_004972 [Tegillarca granosa]|uniref:G-protein coupled receptors family 1 profile domain-containing protein n=1 Tax=Tegillarca granosa TaxID=220873 RepID=A0ABQ9FMY9_TEGGR|nr:hypothetical protein KUTeg_004972 [Tegillarca granosa]
MNNSTFSTLIEFNTTKNSSEENAVNMDISFYIYVWVTFTNVVIFLAGIFGNLMVILVVLKVKEMKTHMNYLLLNLSFADLLVLLICQPSALLEFYAKERWYLGLVMCNQISHFPLIFSYPLKYYKIR